jgi:uncharacterized protein
MALGSAFQASVGIGLALFAVTLLALVDQSFVPGPITPRRRHTRIDDSPPRTQGNNVPALRSSLVGLAVGAIAGAVALRFASGPLLAKTFGASVLLAFLLRLTGYRFTATRHSLMIPVASRVLWGHGRDPWPAISLVFQNAEPRVARAMLGAFFSVAYLGAVAALAAFGLFEVPQIVRTSASAGATGAECCARPARPVTRYASDNGSV